MKVGGCPLFFCRALKSAEYSVNPYVKMSMLDELEAFIREQVESMGYEFVDSWYIGTRYGKTLRIMADRPGGLTLGDCEFISREIMDIIGERDFGLGNYRLEVSSPGLDRPLKKIEDFKRFCGKKVSIRTVEAHEGRRNYRGILKGVSDNNIYIDVDGCEYCISHEDVHKAHLVYKGEFEKKGRKRARDR